MSMSWKDAAAQLESAPGQFRAQRRNWLNKPGKPVVIAILVGARWMDAGDADRLVEFVQMSRKEGQRLLVANYAAGQEDATATDWEIV